MLLLAEALTQESTVSIGHLISVGGLMFSASLAAIVAAVTTRVSHGKDIEALGKSKVEIADRVSKIEAWQGKAQTRLALVHDRQARSAGTGTYPSLGEDEE